MYGSEVLFIGKEILDFETVHLSFLKSMLGVKQQTTSATIYGDTGRYWENHRVENANRLI